MLRTKIKIKNIYPLIFSLFFAAGLFLSCENAVTSIEDSQDRSEITVGVAETIDISGRYEAEGALPKILTQKSRSAIAVPGSTSNSDIEYYAIARNIDDTTDIIEGEVDTTTQTFLITGIRLGVKWEVEVGVKVNGVRSLYHTSQAKKFTASDACLEEDFFLTPDLSGNGSVNLEMTVDASITDISVILDNATQRTKWNAAVAAAADDAKEISPNRIKVPDLPAGIYELTIYFYQGSGDDTRIAYTTKQSVNVVTGMTTETWRSNGSSLISSTGVFTLTSSIINSYLDSVIYVGDAHRTATNHVEEADNANEGRAFSPLATLNEAIKRIANANVQRDYTIIVSGQVAGVSISAYGSNPIESTDASSITIIGLHQNTGAGTDSANYTDVIKGSSAPVVYVNTNIPVTFKNVKITTNGELPSQEGGGLDVYFTGADVTLERGAWVGNCKIKSTGYTSGGGVVLESGTLTMKDGSVISNNTVRYSGSTGSQNTNGGGLYCKAGVFRMEGGEIHHNSAVLGGGMYVKDADVFIYGNSNIYNNGASTDGGAMYRNGNGKIYIGYKSSTEKETMKGKIYSNSAAKNGGAIWTNGDIYMDSGTIEGNTLNGYSQYKGGAAISGNLYISGSAYIPYGGEEHKNDVKGNIYLVDALTPPAVCINNTNNPGKVAYVALSSSAYRGLSPVSVIASNTELLLEDYKNNFGVVNTQYTEWTLNLNSNKKSLYINAPIYVNDSTGSTSPSDPKGTSNHPFKSIEDACSVIRYSHVDFTISVTSNLGKTEIPDTINGKAASLLIKGAQMQTANPAEPQFNISGNPDGTLNDNGPALTIDTSVPITLEALAIVNGYTSGGDGGGICLASGADLTLSDGVRVTDNKAGGYGGGIYVPSDATLNVVGNVKVWDNTDASEPANPSNIYLPDDTVINVTGALASGSELHVTTETPPSPGNPVTITQNYSAANTVAPYTYFFGDNGTSLWNDDNTEACLKVGGGSIDVNPVYKDITISINITFFEKAVENKTITIKAVDNETGEEIEEGSDTGKINYSYKLFYHGEEVPVSYYQTNSKNFTLGNNLPIGNYILNVNGIYDGKKYSANFEVRIIKDATIETDVSHAVEIISQIESTITVIVTGEMNEEVLTEMSTAIKNLSTEEANVKLDLSNVTGLTVLPNDLFNRCTHLEECHLPEGITEIQYEVFWLCTNLKSVTLPSTLTEVAGSAFYRVPADINLAADGPGLKTVGNAIYTADGKELVFYCNKQEENSSFEVPATVEKIRDYAFCSSGIKNLTFESGSHLTEIGSTVFDCCSNLEEIIIPDSVTTIGSDAFYACSSLANVHLPSELTEVNRLFGGCPMVSIVIPDKVTSIKYASFWGDSTLREITLPASLTEIVSGAFGYCSGIETVKYKGSAEQKAAMTIGDNNGTLTSAEWILNYTGD